MSVLELTPAALAALAPAVETLARAEGLEGHWRAVAVRVTKAPAKAKVKAKAKAKPRVARAARPVARAVGGRRR